MNIELLKPKIKSLAHRYHLDLVVLFGSQTTGKTHSGSDVDVAVIGKVPFRVTQLSMDFSDIFKRDDVEVVDLGRSSPTLMYSVVRDGKLLYERSEGEFLRWKLYATKIWMETAWLRAMRDKKLREWAKVARDRIS